RWPKQVLTFVVRYLGASGGLSSTKRACCFGANSQSNLITRHLFISRLTLLNAVLHSCFNCKRGEISSDRVGMHVKEVLYEGETASVRNVIRLFNDDARQRLC